MMDYRAKFGSLVSSVLDAHKPDGICTLPHSHDSLIHAWERTCQCYRQSCKRQGRNSQIHIYYESDDYRQIKIIFLKSRNPNAAPLERMMRAQVEANRCRSTLNVPH